VIENAAIGQPEIINEEFPAAVVGDDYTATVTIAGGRSPYALRIVDQKKLPEGLTFDVVHGRLTGRVSGSGEWHVKLQAEDSLGQTSGAKTLSLTIHKGRVFWFVCGLVIGFLSCFVPLASVIWKRQIKNRIGALLRLAQRR